MLGLGIVDRTKLDSPSEFSATFPQLVFEWKLVAAAELHFPFYRKVLIFILFIHNGIDFVHGWQAYDCFNL